MGTSTTETGAASLATAELPAIKPPHRSRSISRLAVGGLVTFITSIGLSTLLSAILIFAAASALSAVLGGTSLGAQPSSGQSTSPLASSDVGDVARSLVTFVSYVFFASHFTPLEASGLGGATYSVIGVGSLTIASAALVIAFAFARRLEQVVPTQEARSAFGRGFLIAVPYWVGTVVLYFPSFVSLGPSQLAITLHPSGFGLVLPAALAGIGGGLGAASLRPVRTQVALSIVRGASRAAVGIVVGILLTAMIAAVWVLIESLANSQAPSIGSAPTSPAIQQLGWSLFALVPFYIGNTMGIVWSAALGGSLFSDSAWHPLIYIGPIVGVLAGSLQLRQVPDRIEQGAFALAFGIGSGLVGLLTTPAILNGPSLVSTGWTAFVVALVIGALAALVSPYLLAVPIAREVASHAPITWVSRPLLGAWPREAVQPHGLTVGGATPLEIPHLRIGRAQIAVGSAVALLAAGAFASNAALSATFSPDAAAVDYLTAQGRGDADSMWSMLTYESSASTASPLLSEDALRKMLRYGNNADIKNVRVSDSARMDDANYSVSVHLTKGGVDTTERLHLRRDASRSNWFLYPFWRVVVQPSVVQITTFLHGGAITIDGFNSGVSDSGGSVDVIPGEHEVALAPTDIFQGDDRQIDASNSTSIEFKASLTPAAGSAVNAAIAGLFSRCASSNQVAPPNCPNKAYPLGDHQANVHWTLIGDPISSMKLAIGDESDTITAQGDFTMHVSYDYWYDFDPGYVSHWNEDINGFFKDTLHWNGTGFDIASQSGF